MGHCLGPGVNLPKETPGGGQAEREGQRSLLPWGCSGRDPAPWDGAVEGQGQGSQPLLSTAAGIGRDAETVRDE